jgi:hypothetical protein
MDVGVGIVGVDEVVLVGSVGLLGTAALCANAEAEKLRQSVVASKAVIFLFMNSLLKMFVKTFFPNSEQLCKFCPNCVKDQK